MKRWSSRIDAIKPLAKRPREVSAALKHALENLDLNSEILLQNPTYSHSKIAKLSKVAESSVGGILRSYKETQTIERKRWGGSKKGFVDKNKVNSIIRSITRNPCQSQRDLAKKFECSRFLVRKSLKSRV